MKKYAAGSTVRSMKTKASDVPKIRSTKARTRKAATAARTGAASSLAFRVWSERDRAQTRAWDA
jgi:hypothetical protein